MYEGRNKTDVSEKAMAQISNGVHMHHQVNQKVDMDETKGQLVDYAIICVVCFMPTKQCFIIPDEVTQKLILTPISILLVK